MIIVRLRDAEKSFGDFKCALRTDGSLFCKDSAPEINRSSYHTPSGKPLRWNALQNLCDEIDEYLEVNVFMYLDNANKIWRFRWPVPIAIIDANYNIADRIGVARWDTDAFIFNGLHTDNLGNIDRYGRAGFWKVLPDSNYIKQDFIDKDLERFYIEIRVPENEATSNTKIVQIWTDNKNSAYNAEETVVTTIKNDTNSYRSISMIVVSDNEDDDLDSFKYRTYKATLAGKLWVKYECVKEDNRKVIYKTKVAVDNQDGEKFIKIHPVILFDQRENGIGYAIQEQVELQIQNANERFAQVGVTFVYGNIEDCLPSEDIELNMSGANGLFYKTCDVNNSNCSLTKEAQDIIFKCATTTEDDIHIIFINHLIDPEYDPNYAILGVAITPDAYKNQSDIFFRNNIFIANYDNIAPFTLAHELGHILTNYGHQLSSWKMMYFDASTTKDSWTPKRFGLDEVEKIRKNNLGQDF